MSDFDFTYKPENDPLKDAFKYTPDIYTTDDRWAVPIFPIYPKPFYPKQPNPWKIPPLEPIQPIQPPFDMPVDNEELEKLKEKIKELEEKVNKKKKKPKIKKSIPKKLVPKPKPIPLDPFSPYDNEVPFDITLSTKKG